MTAEQPLMNQKVVATGEHGKISIVEAKIGMAGWRQVIELRFGIIVDS